jgi:hypothetical protein
MYLTQFGPDFLTAPNVVIYGYDFNGQSLSFQVNNLTISGVAPVPIPGTLLLLAPALMALAATRRRNVRTMTTSTFYEPLRYGDS